MTNEAGNLIDVPCDTPATKPRLYTVHGVSEDKGPICTAYPCVLTVRGANFGIAPAVELVVPNEQQTGWYSNRNASAPAVALNVTEVTSEYDEVSAHFFLPIFFHPISLCHF